MVVMATKAPARTATDSEICEALRAAMAVWEAIGALCSIGLR